MKYDTSKILLNDWYQVLRPFTNTPAFEQILDWINEEIANGKIIYPKKKDVFNAFNRCSFVSTKVVMLALDPYINADQANGYAMAVNPNIAIPRTLQHMMIEYKDDIKTDLDTTLLAYADRGVLWLNTALTVEAGKTKSHWDLWQPFTKFVFEQLNQRGSIIYVLLGKEAQGYESLITNDAIIIKAPHPNSQSYRSSAGFYGSKIFSKVNTALNQRGHDSIFK